MGSTASPFDLTGLRALVTGSTRGIGAAIAAGLARAGAEVAIHGRNPDQVEAARARLADQLAADGATALPHGLSFDVTNHDTMLAAVSEFTDRVGGVDVLVNNAGMQYRSPLVDFPVQAWENVVATNLTSCFVLAKHLAVGMIARGRGKIINVCSVQNKLVRGTTAPYAAAKAGLGALSQVMCAEWAAHGVQANGLAPGYIDTELNTALLDDPELSSWVVARTPARRWGSPADLVGPAVWLASSASDFVNGQVIYVDGGMTAVI
jgi:gluconate 5-dehydrogenase